MSVCGAAVFVASAIYLLALWQPERQVRLHQSHLIRAVEKRNWDRFASFVADDYSDLWGHDRTFVLRESREVFRQFLFLTLRQEIESAEADFGRGKVSARLEIEGSGGPLAELAKQHVNGLRHPFTFHWQQGSWKPWDWQLTRVEQPELRLPDL